MAWGTPPNGAEGREPVQQPNVAEERIRQIVREELAVLAAKNLSDGS